jgi:hypothetical protein
LATTTQGAAHPAAWKGDAAAHANDKLAGGVVQRLCRGKQGGGRGGGEGAGCHTRGKRPANPSPVRCVSAVFAQVGILSVVLHPDGR